MLCLTEFICPFNPMASTNEYCIHSRLYVAYSFSLFFLDISSVSPFSLICIIDKLRCMDCATPCHCQNIRQPKELLFLFVKLLNERARALFCYQLKCKHFLNVCLLFGFGWLFGCLAVAAMV